MAHMKRKTIFSLAVLLIIAICFTFVPVTTAANAEGDPIVKIMGYEYTAEYLMKEFGIVAEEGKDIFDGRTASYRWTKDKSGVAVAEVTDEDKKDEEAYSKTLSKGVDKVVFLAEGTYTFTVKKGETVEKTVDVLTKNYEQVDEVDVSYDIAKTADFQSAVEKAAENKKTGDSFSVSDIELNDEKGMSAIVSSKYFAYDDLDATIHYCVPSSSTYSTTSSSSFKLDKVGTYSFYVTYVCPNPTGTLSTDELVEGEGGWYKKDDDGNATGDVIIPTFKFTVASSTNPQIVVNNSKQAYLNLEYTKVSDCFTITATDYKSEYSLYFTTELVEYTEGESTEAYLAKIKAAKGFKNLTEDDKDYAKFKTGSLTFTPDTKGYYYVGLRVVDAYNMEDNVISKPIDCTKQFTRVKQEKEFFKYNTTSIIFLSISAACFIAIIVLLCIKPKEEVKLETKSGSKN